MVYVDELVEYDSRFGPSCHLLADTPNELHAFARRLGLRRAWCSDSTHGPKADLHYDLKGARKRNQAILLGAQAVGFREVPAILNRMREARQCPK